MDAIHFPDPTLLPEESDGLVYIGGNLEVENLVQAYHSGIFPWPLEEKYPLFWFCPEPRGVLDFVDLHVPKSLEKARKKAPYRFTFNQAFSRVLQECTNQKRPGQDGTWITAEMHVAYVRFHEAGYAHSIECWRDQELVGGLYGVYVNGVFSGESMFHLESNASKLCLWEMVKRLSELGLEWMDIQMLTPVTEQLGGHYISRRDFLQRLKEEHKKKPSLKLALTSCAD